jgi:hypothetical protein
VSGFGKIFLLTLFSPMVLAYGGQAKERVITLSVAESIITHSDYTSYCQFELTLKKMGYKVKQVPLPLMRTVSEVANGNLAMVLQGQINFSLPDELKAIGEDKVSTTIPYSTNSIFRSSTPYSTIEIALYALKDQKILMDKVDWHNNYLIGLARSPKLHDIQKVDVDVDKKHYFYRNTLSTFKALINKRVDIAIGSELAYASAKLALNLDVKVKKIAVMGTANLYPGFSSLYFGEQKAQTMALQYDNQSANLTLGELKKCNKPAI